AGPMNVGLSRVWLLLPVVACGAIACGDDGGSAIDGGNDAPTGPADANTSRVVVTAYVAAVKSDLLFVAAQHGDGDWRALTGDGGTYTFDAPTGRYGLTFVCT